MSKKNETQKKASYRNLEKKGSRQNMSDIKERKLRTSNKGLVITTAKRKENIRSYVAYAATDEIPYLLSTNSRYNNLVKTNITDQMVASMERKLSSRVKPLVTSLANKIREEEKIQLKKSGLGEKFKAKTVSDLVKTMTAIKKDGNNVLDIAFQRTNYLRKMLFNYMDKSFPFTDEDLFEMMLGDNPVPTIGRQRIINFNEKDQNEINKAFDLIEGTLNFINETETAYLGDLDSVNKALSSIVPTIAKAQAIGTYKLGLDGARFDKLRDLIKNIVQRFAKENKNINYVKNIYSFGFVNEINLLSGLNSLLNTEIEIKNKANINEDEIVAMMVAGKDTKKFGTMDIVLYNKDLDYAVGADAKYIGPVKQEREKLIYQASINFSYGNTLQQIFNDKSLSSEIVRFYRSYLLNRSIHEGYRLSPEERGFITKYYLTDSDNFERVFKTELAEFQTGKGTSSVSGYPLIVTVNNQIFPFSYIVERMDTIFNQSSDTARIEASLAQDLHEPLYRKKVIIGMNKDGYSEKIKGFAAKVPELEQYVKDIERQYDNTNKKVYYGIRNK